MKLTLLLIIILYLTPVIQADPAQPVTLPPGETPPPTAFDRLKNAGSAADFDSAAYAIVYDETVNTINEIGVTYTAGYTLYKILTEEGCRELAVLTWGYEPLTNMVEIEEINILRNDSTFKVNTGSLRDLPAPQHAIYWSDRIKSIQLPRLHVGDGIEVRMKRKGFSYALLDNDRTDEASDNAKYAPPMPGEYFDVVLFESSKPIVEKKYILKMPADKRIHSQVYNGPMYSHTGYVKDTTIYSWWAKDIPAHDPERYSPDLTDLVMKVVIATVESWEAKSRWFFDINEKQFEYNDAIKARVDEILAAGGVTDGTDEEKAFELLHWVAQNIRYSGQTMGKGEGYTLHSGAMIFEQRSGVCKDIAGMLITMMRAAGLDSYGAMTMAGSRIEDIPADQFNHCVVALKQKDGSYVMYDPTWVPYDKDIWSKLETEQHYLIGSPQGETLNRIAYSSPEESPLKIQNDATILPDGTLEGTVQLKGNGAMDHYMRGMLVWYPLEDLDKNIARLFSAAGNSVEIVRYDHGDPADFKHAMWWKIEYRIPDFAFPVDSGLEFVSPMMTMVINSRLLYRGANYDWPKERKDDVFFYFTQMIDGSETIHLPRGYSVAEPKNGETVDETYASFSGGSEMTAKGLRISQNIMIKRRQIPPDGYAGFLKAVTEAKDFAETVFRAEKGGAR